MDFNHMIDKHNSFGVTLVADKKDENKFYIMLEGHVIGVQYKF